jgi:hypothetical protein
MIHQHTLCDIELDMKDSWKEMLHSGLDLL